MKRIITLILVVALSLGALVSCSVNKTEVSVLWSNQSDEFIATMADAVDRAMYIENIKYTHYDAEGNGAKQLEQVDAVIKAGACALLVHPTDLITAGAIVDKAKEADIPVVFICYDAPNELVESYDKCVAITLDYAKLYEELGNKIAEDLLTEERDGFKKVLNYDKYDKNSDGKITYAAFGTAALAVPTINERLKEAGKEELHLANAIHSTLPVTAVTESIDAIFEGFDGSGNDKVETPVELIITDSDDYIEEMLLALRDYEINHKKLVTHFIPLYTVGIAANAGDLIESTQWDEEEQKKEKNAYSVMNAIDDGFLSAAALEDDDALAETAAQILRNFIKGKDTFKDVNEEYLGDGRRVVIPYTIYG